jgi:hypothetical protein
MGDLHFPGKLELLACRNIQRDNYTATNKVWYSTTCLKCQADLEIFIYERSISVPDSVVITEE